MSFVNNNGKKFTICDSHQNSGEIWCNIDVIHLIGTLNLNKKLAIGLVKNRVFNSQTCYYNGWDCLYDIHTWNPKYVELLIPTAITNSKIAIFVSVLKASAMKANIGIQ